MMSVISIDFVKSVHTGLTAIMAYGRKDIPWTSSKPEMAGNNEKLPKIRRMSIFTAENLL